MLVVRSCYPLLCTSCIANTQTDVPRTQVGGAGYIGTHCCVELINAGHKVVVVRSYPPIEVTEDARTRAQTPHFLPDSHEEG